jgi:hypothetical protein
MGMLDANLQFSNAQAITATAASTNIYDQATGLMVTTTYVAATALALNWGPNVTVFAEDLGIGKGPGTPRVVVNVGTVFATLTSLQVQFQGAIDAGGTATSGLTFTTYIMTDTIAAALLTANTRIASFDWPMRKTGASLPRFIRLNYVVAGSSATTGTVTSDITLGDSDAQSTLAYYPSGYTVAA